MDGRAAESPEVLRLPPDRCRPRERRRARGRRPRLETPLPSLDFNEAAPQTFRKPEIVRILATSRLFKPCCAGLAPSESEASARPGDPSPSVAIEHALL